MKIDELKKCLQGDKRRIMITIALPSLSLKIKKQKVVLI
jgi:hypothetical protein